MSTTALDIAAVRARFSALDRRLAFFDGPGGTQCPDEVIDAIARYLREDNANIGAPYETSVRTVELVDLAHETAGRFLGCSADETAFGQSMTSLNFLLSRAFARTLRPATRSSTRPSTTTPTSRRGSRSRTTWTSPSASQDSPTISRSTTPTWSASCRIARESSRSRSRPTRSARPRTSRRIVELAHSAGALAWADAVHYAPHGPIDVGAWDVDVLICSPYKYFGPHMGLAFGKQELLESWRPYKVRPAANEPVGHRFELGTSQHELLAGFVAAVEYMESLGWEAMLGHERALGDRFLAALPATVDLYGLRTMDGRVPTFCFNVAGHSPEAVARFLAEREIAVWHGDYYAVETMKHLGLRRRRARRHRPLQHRGRGRPPARRSRRAGVRLLLLGGPRFLGRAITDSALERGHDLTFFNRGTTNPELYPEVERLVGDRART